MDNSSEKTASCFETILGAELEELKRRKVLRDLHVDPAETPKKASESAQGLYPTRRGKREEKKESSGDDAIHRANAANLFGLAFSGGGIRSATFNLGVLQGLAKRKLLRRVDYLSTISGGGYIGSWLTAWIFRRSMTDVERQLAADRKDQVDYKSPREIEFLREYSNYLTPRKGFLSADTWTAIVIYLRNLILNQLVLALFITSVLLLPRVIVAFATHTPKYISEHSTIFWVVFFAVICILGLVLIFKNMTYYTANPEPDRVVARVRSEPVRVSGQGDHENRRVDVLLLPGYTGDDEKEKQKFWDLLASGPPVEIWDPTITKRRNTNLWKMDPFEKQAADDEQRPKGTMILRCRIAKTDKPVQAGDLIIAAYPRPARPKSIFSFATVPIFLGSILLSCLLVKLHPTKSIFTNTAPAYWWATAGAIALLLLWLTAFWFFGKNLDQSAERGCRKKLSQISAPFSAVIGGAVGGILLWCLIPTLQRWHGSATGMWNVLGFGASIIALILLAATVVQIGILGVMFSEPRREWWGRFAASLVMLCFMWSATFALAGYGPFLLIQIGHLPRAKWIAVLSWIFSTGLGVFGAKSAKSGDPESNNWKDVALSVTPYIFIVGLLMLVALGINASPLGEPARPGPGPASQNIQVSFSGKTVVGASGTPTLDFQVTVGRQAPASQADTYWNRVNASDPLRVYLSCLVCFVASLLLALRVDLNEFSMHYLYRNRLVRCYLGASHRERVPNPFTGFDENDDIPLADLTTRNHYDGPIPLLGAALNLVHGKELAWQERKAESFSMTPLTCGFDVWFERSARPGQYGGSNLDPCGYRPTDRFAYEGGLYLGTAMAISGAAASPNMGYHSSPALSFLLTVFNVRLGWWVGNPRRRDRWQNAGPLFGLGYLLVELLGATDDTGSYVYLSDGGHFENLGLYELVKRRCRFIIASDADADKTLAFGDLASAIRKCRSDMGIDIKMRTNRILATGTPLYSKWHCAIGEICYKDSDPGANNGILLYIKASLTSDESPDILNYKSQYPNFPHQTTADQWFTESQFESYRALGKHAIASALKGLPADAPKDLDEMELDTLFGYLDNFWKNPEEIEALPWPPDTGP